MSRTDRRCLCENRVLTAKVINLTRYTEFLGAHGTQSSWHSACMALRAHGTQSSWHSELMALRAHATQSPWHSELMALGARHPSC
ncbi:hypothetical protein J6590_072422 [Homalodisca vitripennis]|nr:hypothetical protein J6590_072422 [Homalodisca vitripennis]